MITVNNLFVIKFKFLSRIKAFCLVLFLLINTLGPSFALAQTSAEEVMKEEEIEEVGINDSEENSSPKEKDEDESQEAEEVAEVETTEEEEVLPRVEIAVDYVSSIIRTINIEEIEASRTPKNWPPAKPSMEKMKTKGCVFDGLLSAWGDEEENIEMVNRSECEYLHRAIETWLDAPDFEEIEELMEGLERDDLIINMFIAEAIDTKEDFYYPLEDRDFDFKEMCREGSKNFWGEHTCKPDLKSKEYRKYIRYITQRAMNLGVTSFMFGQIYHQDDLDDPQVADVVREMKDFAKIIGIEIVVGAQTNDITDEEYLRIFDFIEGGTGLHNDGGIENNACFSRWWKKPGDWCWALLWHENFSSKANNVFIHLDWSGKRGDDMSRFTRLDEETREETLEYLHKYITDQGHGFLMPFMGALPRNNGGCYGEKERYYSASKNSDCADEESINQILGAGKLEED